MKAIGLISGGLDSILALQLMKEQNFEIIGVFIKTPFLSNFGERTIKNLEKLSREMNFKLIVLETGAEYIDIVKNPEFGYGKNLNPCIDCHIYMLKRAKEIMEKENGVFVFTGEVLGQRGKSQNFQALKIIEEKSSLKGKLLRPLTALNLEPTEVENKGIVNRNLLLGIKGRSRKLQLYLAEVKGLKYYETPSTGCLLTDPCFCKKLKDLFENSEKINLKDCFLLHFGRHFRVSPDTKLIISRNDNEIKKMMDFCDENDYLIFAEKNPQIIGIIKGKLEDIVFDIFGGYIKTEADIIKIKNIRGDLIESRIVQKTNKIDYQKFLI